MNEGNKESLESKTPFPKTEETEEAYSCRTYFLKSDPELLRSQTSQAIGMECTTPLRTILSTAFSFHFLDCIYCHSMLGLCNITHTHTHTVSAHEYP